MSRIWSCAPAWNHKVWQKNPRSGNEKLGKTKAVGDASWKEEEITNQVKSASRAMVFVFITWLLCDYVCLNLLRSSGHRP